MDPTADNDALDSVTDDEETHQKKHKKAVHKMAKHFADLVTTGLYKLR